MPNQTIETVSPELVGLLGLMSEVPQKAPTKPTIAYIDGDVTLFSAASICEQVNYVFRKPNGREIVRFESAKEGEAWLAELEIFGVDIKYGFDGDPDELIRTTEYVVDEDIKAGQEFFKRELKKMLKAVNVKEYVLYVSKAAGADNFRHHVATLKPYKGNRSARKPVKLESMRAWALKNPNIKRSSGAIEVDDIVQSRAQAKGDKAVLIAFDKDARTATGCWILIPSEMGEPVYSDPYIVGELEWSESSKKAKGYGWLFLLWQSLAGDSADNIGGCKGVGTKGACTLLEEFSGQHINKLPDALKVVCQQYESTYGESFSYTHCTTGDMITRTWQEILIENLTLLYMLRSKDDVCPLIKLIEGIDL